MKFSRSYFAAQAVALLVFSSCASTPEAQQLPIEETDTTKVVAVPDSVHQTEQTKSQQTINKALGHGYDFIGNGKGSSTIRFQNALDLHTPPLPYLLLDSAVREGLLYHQRYLKRVGANRQYRPNGAHFIGKDLRWVVDFLLQSKSDTVFLDSLFQCYQVAGEDSLGNVHFTGYFSPIIPVKAAPDSIYRFPLYRQPPGKLPLPSRKAIDINGALKGQGLEIAWAKDLLSVYFMQVQGSGYLEFPDGKRVMAQYGGKNGHSYRSLGKMLVESGEVDASKISMQAIRNWFDLHPDRLAETLAQNPSYTFFAPSNQAPSGATGLPLTAGNSVAADPSCLPLGSCLLARVPTLNNAGIITGHEFRLLLVQDQGAAVKGFGHVDLYTGAGKSGGQRAGNLHHYGNLWLILPKNR